MKNFIESSILYKDAVVCVVASIVILFTMGVNLWFFICSTVEAVSAFILCFAQEHWEIKHSFEQYTDFRKSAEDLYNWLDQYNIRTKDEIEEIQSVCRRSSRHT